MADDGNDSAGGERRASARRSTFERHAQTALASLATIAMIWVGSTMLDLSKEQVRTTEQILQMRTSMTMLQDQLARTNNDRYTSSEARRDRSEIEARLQKLDDRLERLERRR